MTLCWRGESRANQSLKWGFFAAGITTRFQDVYGMIPERKGVIFGVGYAEFWFDVPRLAASGMPL
jgi:hypothetical protein